jgi:endonuclease YncB( thermonuclease family)
VNLEQMKAGAAWHFKRYAADAPEIERIQYEAAEVEAREAKHVFWQ